MNQTEIIRAMLEILAAHQKRPLKTYNFQLPDGCTVGAVVRWISEDTEEYKSIRAAANKAGLWFAYTKTIQKFANGSHEISVLVVENKRKK